MRSNVRDQLNEPTLVAELPCQSCLKRIGSNRYEEGVIVALATNRLLPRQDLTQGHGMIARPTGQTTGFFLQCKHPSRDAVVARRSSVRLNATLSCRPRTTYGISTALKHYPKNQDDAESPAEHRALSNGCA